MGVEGRVVSPEPVAVDRALAADGGVFLAYCLAFMMSQGSLDVFVIHWDLGILKTFRSACC